MIVPTVGRVVWFHPASPSAQKDGSKPIHRFAADPVHSDAPLAAIITGIRTDGRVNLNAMDFYGHAQAVQGVRLVQPEEDMPDQASEFCCWMPYQVGQAERTRQAEAAADAGKIVKVAGPIPTTGPDAPPTQVPVAEQGASH